MSSIEYLELTQEDLEITPMELAARLGLPSVSDPRVKKEESRLRRVISPKIAAKRVRIVREGEGVLDLEFSRVKSRDLEQALEGYEEAYVMAVTLGIGADRLISSSYVSAARIAVLDGVASALAEALADKATHLLVSDLEHSARFSPGYGDLPLPVEKDLLEFLDSKKTLGITLTDSLLMVPTKSVTAIIGVGER